MTEIADWRCSLRTRGRSSPGSPSPSSAAGRWCRAGARRSRVSSARPRICSSPRAAQKKRREFLRGAVTVA